MRRREPFVSSRRVGRSKKLPSKRGILGFGSLLISARARREASGVAAALRAQLVWSSCLQAPHHDRGWRRGRAAMAAYGWFLHRVFTTARLDGYFSAVQTRLLQALGKRRRVKNGPCAAAQPWKP